MSLFGALIQLIPEHSIPEITISVAICLLLGIFARWNKILDTAGAISSVIIGLVIAIFGNIYWLITLICFLMVTFLVTKLGFSFKKRHGVAQGRHGERNAKNVLANGLILAIIPILRPILGDPLAGLMFIICICEAASDSFANEIGVLSNRAYLITNLRKRVRPGTDGGVSILGTFAGLLGAFIPAIIGWILISEFNGNIYPISNITPIPMNGVTLLLPILIGFLGCHIDSILGATLQRQKIISNDDVNFTSILLTFFIGMAILMIIPI
jgi:uncharacterized protein (TIGR00297 family)